MIRARTLAAAACVACVAAAESEIDPAIRGVLTRYMRFTTSELADLDADKVVRHGLESGATGEVGVVGAVKVHARKTAFLARVRDIARFKSGPDILQIGTFSHPPKLEDLASLVVDANDFDVKSCRVRSCSVRLPAPVIERFEKEVDLKAADAQQRGAELFKRMLFDDVSAYVAGSPGRFDQYDDGARPIRPLEDFDGLLENSPALAALVPGLPEHLKSFPSARLSDAEDFLYWSKEKFGYAPFISVTHVTIVCPSPSTCVMTTKDVYSSRYIDASLAIAVATDTLETPEAFFLVYGNRSRANALKGTFSGLRRMLVERRARGSLEDNLRTLKLELEKKR